MRGISFSSYLRYIVCGEANSPVFVTHASFPRIPLRKWLLEVIWYFFWVFGEYPFAVIEYCCQDIESKRQRSAVYDCQVHILYSPKTQTRNQRRKRTYCSVSLEKNSSEILINSSQSPDKALVKDMNICLRL